MSDLRRPATESRPITIPARPLNWGNRQDRANLPPNVLHYDPAGEGVGIGSPLPGSGAPVLEEGSWAAAMCPKRTFMSRSTG